jgi:CRISPR-associated endonuclease/helicase Cas3
MDVGKRLCGGDRIDRLLSIAGLFHDLGKATEFFQSHLHGRPCDPYLKQHAQFGAIWLLDFLKRKVVPSKPNSLLEASLFYLLVRRHHGRLDDLVDSLRSPSPDEDQRWIARLSAADVNGAKAWLESQLGETVEIPRPEENWWTQIRVELQRRLPPFTKISDPEAFVRFQSALRAFGRLIEADRDSASGFIETSTARRFTSDDLAQFRTEPNFGVAAQPQIARARELIFQRAVAQAASRPSGEGYLWTLEVPTGAGKTLAAFGWAIERRRLRLEAGQMACPIIYALPFTSIIDQTATVMRGICPAAAKDPSILAIHHHLADPPEGEGRSLSQSWAENWRADVICTTFVQVVNALFHGTCADSRRLAQLTGSILVLDEVQAIRADLWPVLRASLTSLSKNFCTDILLVTATQPAIFADQDTVAVGPVELPKELISAFDRYDLRVQTGEPLTINSLTRQLEGMLGHNASSASCLVILNTVQEALDLHESISQSALLSHVQLLHLSTNLRPKDRATILEKLRQPYHTPRILVATQVVEAGVDISFDVVFRAIAPLDAIIQAAGRCNRHGSGKRGEVIVFKLEGNSDRLIYGDVHMDIVRQLFAEIAEIILPEPALTGLVRCFFAEVSKRKEKSKSRHVGEAVAMLQFAALRGEGDDRYKKEKAVRLTEEQRNIVPHFIETDESDEVLWRDFNQALLIVDGWGRRQQLRGLRSAIGQRVVEVREKHALGAVDEKTGLVHVPRLISAKYYDCGTGWRRNR